MRVLIVRAGALGDVILLRRAIAAVRRVGGEVALMAPAVPASALASEVSDTIPWDGPEVAALLAGDPPASLRNRITACELAIVLSRSVTVVEALRPLLPRVVAQDPAPGPGFHAARWLARPLAELGFDTAQAPGPLAVGAPPALPLAPGFLAIHPGAGSPRKMWPAERFASLADALSPDQPWLLVIGRADAAAAAPLRAHPRAVVAEGRSLADLAALLARAGLYVGNDSGVTHLAAATGTRTIALFGPTDPDVWRPDSGNVVAIRSPTDRIEDLLASTVLAAR